MRAIVFGGSGFVGSHVADALSEAGHEVTIFDVRPARWRQPGQDFIAGDITDADAVSSAVAQQDVVYHFAGLADIAEARDRPRETAVVNVAGTVNILEAARTAEIRRFVFASSIYVGGESGSFYRVSKQACELYIEEYQREHDLDYTVLRYGTLFGPRADDANAMHRYLRQALEERRIVAYGTGDELREYIHVSDAARLSVDVLAEEFANQQVVLSGHHPLHFRELLTLIKEIVGTDVEIELRAPDDAAEPTQFYSGHYTVTPYAFRPKLGRKLVSSYYIDLGQGLLDCLQEISDSAGKPQS